MKPLALALAAALLGTGCFIDDDDDCSARLTITWNDFLRFDNQLVGCADAGVVWVDTWVDGVYVSTTPCENGGVTLAPVASGTHDVLVEGIDDQNRIAYRDGGPVTASGCGTTGALALQPAEGSVNLNYDDPGCASTECFLWFSVFDEVAQDYAAVVAQDSPATIKDDWPYPEDVVIRLPVGSFTLDWMELVSAGYGGLFITCDPLLFDVAGGAENDLPVSLACLP